MCFKIPRCWCLEVLNGLLFSEWVPQSPLCSSVSSVLAHTPAHNAHAWFKILRSEGSLCYFLLTFKTIGSVFIVLLSSDCAVLLPHANVRWNGFFLYGVFIYVNYAPEYCIRTMLSDIDGRLIGSCV